MSIFFKRVRKVFELGAGRTVAQVLRARPVLGWKETCVTWSLLPMFQICEWLNMQAGEALTWPFLTEDDKP